MMFSYLYAEDSDEEDDEEPTEEELKKWKAQRKLEKERAVSI